MNNPRTTQRAGQRDDFDLDELERVLSYWDSRQALSMVRAIRRTIEQQQARIEEFEELEAAATAALCDRNGTYCFTHLGHHQPVRVDDALRQALDPSTKGEGE